MTLEIIPYSQCHESEWELFCDQAENSTILHTRRFLSYHGNKFADKSLMIMESGKFAGLIPAAESRVHPDLVISHPGITYGGVVHAGRLSGMRMVETLTKISLFYKESGYQRFQYKPVPFIYSSIPVQDDLYALFRLGARRIRSDLSSAIDLSSRRPISERRSRSLKKAKKVVTLSSDPALLNELWEIVAQNLAWKHDAKPVHSLSELELLRERFPQHIVIRCALINGKVEAGVVFFNSSTVWHAQYIGASEIAYNGSALDAVFDAAINEAQSSGAKYFDFGTSNEEEGWVLNDGLYRFKSEFGGGGVVHEYYEINLGQNE